MVHLEVPQMDQSNRTEEKNNLVLHNKISAQQNEKIPYCFRLCIMKSIIQKKSCYITRVSSKQKQPKGVSIKWEQTVHETLARFTMGIDMQRQYDSQHSEIPAEIKSSKKKTLCIMKLNRIGEILLAIKINEDTRVIYRPRNPVDFLKVDPLLVHLKLVPIMFGQRFAPFL